MANLTRFDPFKGPTPFGTEDPFDEMFRGFFRPLRPLVTEPIQLKMDVREDDKSYTVHAEIPGVKKEDIQVEIDGNQVSISAETKQEKEAKEGEKLLHTERYYGKVSRSFALSSEIDESAAQGGTPVRVAEIARV